MYECPNRAEQREYDNADSYFEAFFWHHNNCTCEMMALYHFMMIDQDDHIRAFWEALGRQKVRWDIEYGMLLSYPKGIKDLTKIRYPYHRGATIKQRPKTK